MTEHLYAMIIVITYNFISLKTSFYVTLNPTCPRYVLHILYGHRSGTQLLIFEFETIDMVISKILMYEFWYDYIKPKYGDRANLCYTDTHSFFIYIKTEDIFEDISNDVERWFDKSKYDKNDKQLLPIGKNKKIPGLFKDELGEKIIIEVIPLRPKTYAYLMDDGSNHKKAKGTKKCVIKQKLMFQNYKDCLFNNKTVYRSQERFKSYYHDMYTEEVNKIALSSNGDKRLQTFDWITTYPYGTNEMIIKQS